jgi:hypothetical protein
LRQQKAQQEAALGLAPIQQPPAKQQHQRQPEEDLAGEQPPTKRVKPSEAA